MLSFKPTFSLSSFTFHFHALEKETATHSSILAWRIPGTGEPDGLPPMGSHRVGHDWSDLAAAAAAAAATTYWLPIGHPLVCLQTLPDVLWQTMLPLVENHFLRAWSQRKRIKKLNLAPLHSKAKKAMLNHWCSTLCVKHSLEIWSSGPCSLFGGLMGYR